MLILPQHEQNYPSLLMKTRLEEYVRDGQPPSLARGAAILVTGQQVCDAVNPAKQTRNMMAIDTRYFVGTCFHEAGCTNEWDTEIATASSPTGFISVGGYQIGQEEAQRYGYTLADMLDFAKASDCMVQLANDNLKVIQAACSAAIARGKTNTLDYVDPKGQSWANGGVRAYLAICHNHGAGYVRTTILNYGLDWVRYKERNPHDDIVAHQYGEDCVTGGEYWPAGQ